MQQPHFQNEIELWLKGYSVIGVDEVGRGSFAGPLMVGAVCFRPLERDEIKYWSKIGINDSKKLKPLERMRLAKLIREKLCYAVASSSVSKINKHGIVKSTQGAIRQAIQEVIKKLNGDKFYVLSDAFYIKYVRGIGLKRQKAIVHGDEISLTIAAASIVAKVERDKLMKSLAKKHPNYLWGRNKGYGTKAHQEAIKTNGLTNYHRLSFVRNLSLG